MPCSPVLVRCVYVRFFPPFLFLFSAGWYGGCNVLGPRGFCVPKFDGAAWMDRTHKRKIKIET